MDNLSNLTDLQLAEMSLKYRGFLTEQRARLSKVEEVIKKIDNELIQRMNISSLDRVEFPNVKVTKSIQKKYTIDKEHGSVFYKFLKDTYKDRDPSDMFSFFGQSVLTSAIKDYINEHGITPPGISDVDIIKLYVTQVRK